MAGRASHLVKVEAFLGHSDFALVLPIPSFRHGHINSVTVRLYNERGRRCSDGKDPLWSRPLV